MDYLLLVVARAKLCGDRVTVALHLALLFAVLYIAINSSVVKRFFEKS
jgi:hypothetical protein